MHDRRELRSFAMVMVLIGAVCATTLLSCGGGGGGSSNGDLCQQCGDTDGPCNAAGAETTGDQRPDGCTSDPCHVALACVRKVDSGQRRCYPLNPSTNELDLFYECDGSRPMESFAPTSTPLPSVTLTPSATPTVAETGPTATGPTPSATGPTPTATASPGQAEDVDVSVTVADPNDNDLPTAFSGTVTYPPSKGKFLQGGALDCTPDEGLSATDNGSGTLTITFALADTFGVTDASITCTFHQVAGQTLAHEDLAATVTPNTLTITIDEP